MTTESETLRQEAIEAIKKQKSSWIKLGKALFDIFMGNSFKEWGYEKFSDYCKEELGLNHGDAKKMMSAYEYIKNNEPSVLNTIEKDPDAYIPDFQTVSALNSAVKRDALSDEEKKDFSGKVFCEEVGSSTETLKEIKDTLAKKDKDSGKEILEDIDAVKKKLQKQVRSLVARVHECTAFDNDVLDAADKFSDLISKV
jgi:hypothetical protein